MYCIVPEVKEVSPLNQHVVKTLNIMHCSGQCSKHSHNLKGTQTLMEVGERRLLNSAFLYIHEQRFYTLGVTLCIFRSET